MTYELRALIGPRHVLEHVREGLASAWLVPLAGGLALVPLTADLCAELQETSSEGPPSSVPDFVLFSSSLSEWAKRASLHGPIAYVDIDCAGGPTSQAALAWCDGTRALGPLRGSNAVHRALTMLGVHPPPGVDGVRHLGLDRFEHTAEWLAAAEPPRSMELPIAPAYDSERERWGAVGTSDPAPRWSEPPW